ncbi:MAG: hypothetical protein HQM04_02195 [Magnetococcales bacterium]|nr:hypothetical protein [Magnetococcales bacterium]MBF0113830.1 hypothetical protein [Magnetococcales bacterium]
MQMQRVQYRGRGWWSVAFLAGGLVLGSPWLLWADGGLGVGVLGGALVGSLVGQPKNRVQNALIGAVVGGAVSEMGRAAVQEPAPGVVYRSAPANVVYAEPVRSVECRQMQTQGYIDGRQETLTGMACRAPGSGAWQYQEAPRVVQRGSVYASRVVEQVPMTVYPSQTVVIESLPVVAYPVVTVTPPSRGRYYGHRDVWREEHRRRLDW